MRVLLDVGAHYGETLEVGLDPAWGFDTIYSFEPEAKCQQVLQGFREPRLRLVRSGLSNVSQTRTLYGAGLLGASVYADKEHLGAASEQQEIRLERATDWLNENTDPGDEIYLKLNCEGSECDVLEDLLDSGAISRIKSVYVDFDVRKIPSQAHRQESVERRLRERDVNYFTPTTLGCSGGKGVATWLAAVCPVTGARHGQLRYRLRLYRPPYLWATAIARAALPHAVFVRLAQRIGRQSRSRAAHAQS